jgi:hypothetical protein
MKHLVCYSGGESSALVAVEVARRFGIENLILLNHDINPWVESADIKRFKQEVAAHIGIPITYANMEGWDTKDQFDVVVEARAFKVGKGTALCTHRMKTKPFYAYLDSNFPRQGQEGEENYLERGVVIYYGFDKKETNRITRRASILGADDFKTDYPLAFWSERTIQSISEIGIKPPCTYDLFKHANCVGCLKAGKQHWYVVYCTRPDVWAKALWAEDCIGYSIIKDFYLADLEPLFARMKCAGIPITEHIKPGTFWKMVREKCPEIEPDEEDLKPCECVI